MTKLFELIAEQTEDITKEAFAGAALRLAAPLVRGATGVGKAVLKRPVASFGAAMTGAEVGSGAKKFTNMSSGRNPYRTSAV